MQDRLFLLQPDFEDPAYPGQRFYCWHCALLEGVLASFPALAGRIDVERIPWTRPRALLVALVGEENQSMPILILAPDAPDAFATGFKDGVRYVSGKDEILAVLSRRHGFPDPHP